MKENLVKGTLSVAFAALCGYLGALLVPLIVLVAVMIVDYITGMVKAWSTSTLNSRIGIKGILKKVGYLVIVAVGMVIDWLLADALTQIGINLHVEFMFALLVIIWLIINECVSILENVAAIGAPVPDFITKIIGKLKNTVEDKAGAAAGEAAAESENKNA